MNANGSDGGDAESPERASFGLCSGRPAVGVSPRGSRNGCAVIYVSGSQPLCDTLSLTYEVHPS